MKKIILFYISIFFTLQILSGCVPREPRYIKNSCSDRMLQQGYYCYQGHNFGKSRSEIYRSGIKDGCHTANGKYTKNYTSSKSSKVYRAGWDAGRAKCKLIIPEEAEPGMRTEYQQSIDEKKYYR